MKVQLKDIVLAVPALSKLSAGDLQLRLAYKLKRMITALQKEADFLPNSGRKSLKNTAQQRRTAALISPKRTSRKPPPNWKNC